MLFTTFQGTASIEKLWLWFVAALLNVMMQELLVRGYLYQLIKKNYSIKAAVIATTALFAFMHGGAFEAGVLPVLSIITMSLLMTVILEYTESLVTPISIHFIWNSIGCLILGSVSLAEDYPSLLSLEFLGNKVLSGGVFKLEGSIIVLVLNLILCGLFLFLNLRKKQAH